MATASLLLTRIVRGCGLAPCRRGMVAIVACLLASLTPGAPRAQSVDTYFPNGTSGYDRELGVTVLSRQRPLYSTGGIQAGGFVIRPRIDESFFYNSNPMGNGGGGSAGVRTSGAASVDSTFRRNSLGVSVSVDDYRFLSLPQINYTDWNVGVRGGYTIADSELAVAYSHQNYNVLGTTIAAVSSARPALNTIDTARINYTFNLTRLSFTPELSVSAYRFGDITVGGTKLDQGYLDRNVLAGGVTTRYSLRDVGALVLVVRGASARYLTRQPGQPITDSTTVDVLAGVDYQARGPWRFRLLAGGELQSYRAAQYSTQTAVIVEGSVIWIPTGRATFTGTVSRSIQSPQSAGISGYTLSQARLTADFELLRNVLLQARGGVKLAEFLPGGGSQTNFSIGAGVNYLINPRLRASLDADYVQQSSRNDRQPASNPAMITSGPFTQTVVALTLRFAL